MSEMWLWFCLMVGIILGVVCCLPEAQEHPTDEVEVETITAAISVDELLEEWDLQDHLDELEDEEEEE